MDITVLDHQHIDEALAVAQAETMRYNDVLYRRLYGKEIDEVALLVNAPEKLMGVTTALHDRGWQHFNEALDRVATGPIRSTYEVQYHFFQKDGCPWRIELMCMVSGVSPLHAPLVALAQDRIAVPVHASFKCRSEERYAFARLGLEESGYVEAQRCESTYGRFSYFLDPDRFSEVPYLKPRVNLRDADGGSDVA